MNRTQAVRIVLLLIATLLFAYGTSPVSALEEGHHLHLGITNLPTTAARSNYTFNLHLQAHRQPNHGAAWVRVSDYSTVKDSIVGGKRTKHHTIALPDEGAIDVAMTVPFGEWACGRHELRFTVNLTDNFEDNRQFTTSRTYITLGGCSTDRSGRPSDWYGGGGGWYDGEDYAVGIQQTPFAGIRSGASTRWRLISPASRGCLFLNPSAHAGTMGTPIGACWNGTGTVTRTMPTLDAGDKVMLYAEDASPSRQHAGTYVVTVGSGPTWQVDYQDWWDSGGLSVP